jgi:1,4-dihydroxy-2-naphthoate octaprenyltransferase
MNVKDKIFSWIKIARFQFYPMTLIAYSLGAALSQEFRLSVYLLGYLVLFLIEFATILANEYYDYPSDRINKNASPFNGGTRVLVEGRLKFTEVKIAIWLLMGLIIVAGFLLACTTSHHHTLSVVLLIIVGMILGLGYTVPPLKFSHRGLGEVVVGVTHSLYVILCGYVFQTGMWKNPLPWLLSIPLFFAVLGAISLSTIPDHRADKTAGKTTISVILGPKLAAYFSMGFITLAALSTIILSRYGFISFPIFVLILIHAAVLWLSIVRLIKSSKYDRRIDLIMKLALSYIIWFGIVPLISTFHV